LRAFCVDRLQYRRAEHGKRSRSRPEILDGKYLIVAPLGEGGMGAVYQATHLGTTRTVAINGRLCERKMWRTVMRMIGPVAALILVGTIVGSGAAEDKRRDDLKKPLVLASQGSFFVGGESKAAAEAISRSTRCMCSTRRRPAAIATFLSSWFTGVV
jgi:hypothetical protein